MDTCLECNHDSKCAVQSDLVILAGIHGIQIAIVVCPMYKNSEEADGRILDVAQDAAPPSA